jgi:predicted MFS family arabinose efflux permease
LLYLGPFVSAFDRFAIAPLLYPISRDLRVPLAAVAAAATLYYLLYGALQPVYGLLSDRYGRVLVMRVALAVVALGSIASSVAPTLPVLVAGRIVTGATVGAVIPTSIVYVGDRFPFAMRQRAIVDLNAATAAGTAAGILGAGVMATFVNWRMPFATVALAALALVLAFRRLPESLPPGDVGGPRVQFARVLASRWAIFLIVIAIVEGIVFQGTTTYLAPALQARGASAAVAGLTVAAYGVATLVGTRLVRLLTRRVHAAGLIGIGGGALVTAYLVAAGRQDVAGLFLASAFAGLAFASMHSTLQTWITEVAPGARGTATALFAATLFLGASAGAGAGAPLAERGLYSELFLLAAGLSLLVAVVAGSARWAYKAG